MNILLRIKEYLIQLRELLKKIFLYNKPFVAIESGTKEEIEDIIENEIEEDIMENESTVIDNYPHNYNDYSSNIYEPSPMYVNGHEYTCYRAQFNSLYDLYSYLKSEPKLNREIFRSLKSEENAASFAGVPYEQAVEELMAPPRSGYSEFLRLSKRLDEAGLGYVQEFIDIMSPGGGVVDIPSFVTGSPLCYKSQRSIYTPKFIRVYITLSYYWGTTKEQVLNRALIISSLVNAFERAGYVVELNTFEMSQEGDELIYINVNIKNNSETFNKASLYKSLCYVEFLRRILFRILETLDVKEDWQHGYGQTSSEKFVRDALKFEPTDIFFDQPGEMGIGGTDIASDFENALKHLKLENIIDVDQAKKEFANDIVELKKTIK